MIVITLISCWLKHGLNVKKKLKSEITEIVANDENCREKTKSIDNHQIINAFYCVGMTGFEPATSRPPDVYSNRTELHPELCECKSTRLFWILQMFAQLFLNSPWFRDRSQASPLSLLSWRFG